MGKLSAEGVLSDIPVTEAMSRILNLPAGGTTQKLEFGPKWIGIDWPHKWMITPRNGGTDVAAIIIRGLKIILLKGRDHIEGEIIYEYFSGGHCTINSPFNIFDFLREKDGAPLYKWKWQTRQHEGKVTCNSAKWDLVNVSNSVDVLGGDGPVHPRNFDRTTWASVGYSPTDTYHPCKATGGPDKCG